MPFDPDDYSALARKLFDPSGWKERTYGDPTVRLLIVLREPMPRCGGVGFAACQEGAEAEVYFRELDRYACAGCAPAIWGRREPVRCGALLPVPRPIAEVADAVLAYRERLLAFAPFPVKLSLA